MFKETVILPKGVVAGSASVKTEVVVNHPIDQSEQVSHEEPQKEVETEEPPMADDAPDEVLESELLREQNEILLQIKELFQNIHDAVQLHIQDEKSSLEKVFEKVPSLAFSIAEKIVHQKVQSDNSVIADTVRHIISATGEKSGLKITLNPNDVQLVRSLAPEFGIEEEMLDKHWEIGASKDITPGGCLVRTSSEEIDARIESQLNALRESILEVSE